MERKTKYLIITLCCIFGVIIGTTTAWYTWTSSENTDVTFTIGGLTITYEAGDDITGSNLRPTISKEIGVENNYAIKKDITVSSDKTAYLSLYLTISELATELRHESLKWELYENFEENEILLSSGNFKDVSNGDRILLVGNTKTDDYIRNLTLYIYIDGNMDNPSEMGNKTYNFVLNAEATDEKGEYIYNIPHTQINDTTPGVLSGSGTEEDPYLIESVEDLIAFSNNVNSGTTYKDEYISLKQTLDFNSDDSYVDSNNTTLFGDYNGDGVTTGIKEEVTTGQGFITIGTTDLSSFENVFYGTFFGNDKTIKNLYINYNEDSTYTNFVFGLFGCVESPLVENLSVTGNISVIGVEDISYYVGGIIGIAQNSKIENINNFVNSHIENNGTKATRIGGLIGYTNKNVTISNCINHETVKITGTAGGQLTVGGIVSTHKNGVVSNCSNYGSFDVHAPTEIVVGGVVGYNYSNVENSINYGDIDIQDEIISSIAYIGGIGGYNNAGEFLENINYGEINVKTLNSVIYAGGILSSNWGVIDRCINSKSGNVNAFSETQYVTSGGLVAQNANVKNSGIITSSYNMASISGYENGTENGLALLGGITGDIYGGTISNSYNVGQIVWDKESELIYAGGITGYLRNAAIVTNSYYLNTIEPLYGYEDGSEFSVTNSLVKSSDDMKTSSFVDLLNAGLEEPVWVMDTEGINDGYPILSFQQ